MSSTKRKTAIISGASSGIGRETAIKLAEEGFNIAITARNKTDLEKTRKRISANESECLILPLDLSKEKNIKKCIDQTIDTFKRLDVLINAAGIIGSGSVETTELSDWDYMMNINLRSVFYLMKLAVPHLKKSKGTIINVSSVTGLRAFPNILSYCVSKAGVDQLTRCAALELAPDGIRVNAINPGVMITNLHKRSGMNDKKYQEFLEHSKSTHPLGRVGKPEEAAELIAFLASEKAGWITGTTISIDGGRAQTCAR
ncbi:MAG: SDR family oxidoreductase [bacterium]